MLLSSILGSAGGMTSLGPYAHFASGYSASKAAANMWYRKLALEFQNGSAEKPRDGGWAVGLVSAVPPTPSTLSSPPFSFLKIHPGAPKTDMNPWGDITVEESASGVINVLQKQVTVETSGQFFDWTGKTVPF